MTHIRTFNEEEALVFIKVLIQNGYSVKVYQTDDTLVETIVEFSRKDPGYNPYQE